MKRKADAHVVRFFRPDNVTTVHHMAYNQETDQLAVLRRLHRDNADDESGGYDVIEIWFASWSRTPVIVKRMFVSHERHSKLENVLWGTGGRLFSCGHGGCLNEHDLMSNNVRKSVTVGGGIVWCIAADMSRSNIATGSEDGTISVFAIGQSSESISFGKVVGKCTSRVLSIAWSGDESKHCRIIAGSIDYITIWSLKKGTCLDKLDVRPANVPNGETIVWCMAVCGEYLISGDSNGFTNFWHLTQRVNMKSIQSHESDVLAVAADADGHVFSSGVDPKISHFRIHDHDIDLVHEYKTHKHDVKSLVIRNGGNVMSAGNGPHFVTFRKGNKKTRITFLGFKSQILSSDSSLMFNYLKSLIIYDLSLQAEPVKSLHVKSKACILSSTFSDSFVVYRTLEKLSILKRSPDHVAVVAHKFSEPAISIDHLILVDHVLLIVCGEKISLMNLPQGVVFSEICLPTQVYHCFVVADKVALVQSGGKISVLDPKTCHLTEMQRMEHLVVDHALDTKDTNSFWLLMSNWTILCYNLSTPQISISNDVPQHRHIIFNGIECCKTSLLLYSSDFIVTFGRQGFGLRQTTGAYKHIIRIGRAGEALVVVELSDADLMKIMPAMFDCKSTQSFIK